jgi:hypothetical protein
VPTLHLVEDHRGMLRHAGPAAPPWAVAVARRDDVIVFRLDRIGRSPATRLEAVAAHEAVHQVLAHLPGTPLPRWFEEGLCVHYAGVPFLEADFTVERLAAAGRLERLADTALSFRGDEARAAAAYRIGEAAVREFLRRFGRPALHGILRRLAEGAPFEAAFLETTGVALDSFEAGFRESVTPRVPLWLLVLVEDLGLTLLVVSALLVVVGYVAWRLRRQRALESLGG